MSTGLKINFIEVRTTILEQENNKQRLQILEALHIRNKYPNLRVSSSHRARHLPLILNNVWNLNSILGKEQLDKVEEIIILSSKYTAIMNCRISQDIWIHGKQCTSYIFFKSFFVFVTNKWLYHIYGVEMGGLTEKSTFFGFIFTPRNRIESFTKPKLFGFVLSLLSDHIQGNSDKINFYHHLCNCKKKRLKKNTIKAFYCLVLGNKCEIYLFTKK